MTALFRKIYENSISKLNFLAKSSAMTLVETVVVLSMITTLLGLSAFALNRFYRNSLLDTATAQILSDLKTLQNYAANNYVPPNLNDVTDWKSPFVYQFGLSIFDNKKYSTYAYTYLINDNAPQNTAANRTPMTETSRSVNNGIALSFSNTAVNTIDFAGVENRMLINGTCQPNHACLKVALSDSTTEYRLIYINCSSKIIKELDIVDEAQCN